MRVAVGTVEAIFRYPVKSMRGERLDTATLGWHGVEGDRRFALRRQEDRSGFPWLRASKWPDLVRYTPKAGGDLPTHVVTPDGRDLPLSGLAEEIARLSGEAVEMMQLNHGIFDDATVSVITTGTVDAICRQAQVPADVRRFRPNILIRTHGEIPFEEDKWLGGVLSFGEHAPAIALTMHDVRCAMICIDPDTGARNPEVMKAAVRTNDNIAGIYGTVPRLGVVAVGQSVFLDR